MKRHREGEPVIDDDEARSGDGMKSVDPQKRDDDKINRKREDEQVTLERSGDGMKSVDPQKRDHKIKRKRHREGETVIDDDEEGSGDGMKSVDPQKKDDKVNRKREAEPVIDDGEERSGGGTKSIDPQTRDDDKINRKREDEQVTDDGEERSVDLTKSNDPQKRDDDKINRKGEDEQEIISETRTDFHMECDVLCVPAALLPFASGVPSHALSAEKAEEIISETISPMRATTATPSTSNNPAGAIQAPSPPPRRRRTQAFPLPKIFTKCFKGDP